MIYFIKSESGHIKIGYSNNNDNGAENRLKALQSGCPFKLSVLKTLNYPQIQEKLIHKKFKKLRCQGEWFALTPDLEEYINNPSPIKTNKILEKKTYKPNIKLKELLFEKRLNIKTAAKEIGICRESLANILNGKVIPGKAVSLKILAWSNNMVKLSDLWNM